MLPPSLEKLRVHGIDDDDMDLLRGFVQEIIDAKPELLPALQEVALSEEEDGDDSAERSLGEVDGDVPEESDSDEASDSEEEVDELEDMRELCRQSGILLVV